MYQHQNVSTSSDFKNYQAVASSILAGCPQVPVIAVDLDYTLWPSNCYEHTMPPYSNPLTKTDESTGVIPDYISCRDRRNSASRILQLYPETKQVLEWCADNHIVLTICSRSPDVHIVEQILRAFGIWDWFLFPQVFYSRKSYHFRNLSEATNLKMKDFLFFDDDMNNIKIINKIGVTSRLVDKQTGLNWNALIEGLKSYSTQLKTMHSFQNWFVRANSINNGYNNGNNNLVSVSCETIAEGQSYDSHDVLSLDLDCTSRDNNNNNNSQHSSSHLRGISLINQFDDITPIHHSANRVTIPPYHNNNNNTTTPLSTPLPITTTTTNTTTTTLFPTSTSCSSGSSSFSSATTTCSTSSTSSNNSNNSNSSSELLLNLNQYSGSCSSNNNTLHHLLPFHINTSFHLPAISHNNNYTNYNTNTNYNTINNTTSPRLFLPQSPRTITTITNTNNTNNTMTCPTPRHSTTTHNTLQTPRLGRHRTNSNTTTATNSTTTSMIAQGMINLTNDVLPIINRLESIEEVMLLPSVTVSTTVDTVIDNNNITNTNNTEGTTQPFHHQLVINV